ncbi:MAG: hypothetical protein QXT26_00550 [Thermoproteota archaeon]
MPPISPEEFIEEMEGCIREGTPKISPLKLKEIWETVKRLGNRRFRDET